MAGIEIEGPLAALRESEIYLLTDIASALGDMDENAQDDRKRLLDVAQDLRELFFLVVVIGEFNAGKSSFVNALIGNELLPTGITPTTEVIELIRHNPVPNRKPHMRDDSLREWAHPNTGGAGIAIVDTPGTGSVFQRHEKTAKDFLHRSDLVIFVLSAKRAFAETERIYLETAKQYGKKVVLVVNQVDLLTPAEQTQVRRFIEQQVKELLNLEPLLFMVSAKEALAGIKDGAAHPRGGIDSVRAHLRGVFDEVPPAKQKLLSPLEMAAQIVKHHLRAVQTRSELVNADTLRVREVQQELQQQSLGMEIQLRDARDEIDTVFAGLGQRGLNFIDTNLSIRRLGRSVNRERLQAEFNDVVIGRSLRDINEATEAYVNSVVDHSRLYWRGVIDRLNQLKELLAQEVGGPDGGLYAEQRENLQEAIRIAEGELKTYSSGQVMDEIRQTFETNMSGFTTSALATLGGLIVTLIATIGTPGPLVGVGAAAFALPAFLIAAPVAVGGSLVALRYYRRITSDLKKNFKARVAHLQATYHSALDDLTRRERNRLGQYGNQTLMPIFSRLEVLAQRYADQKARLETYQTRIRELQKSISES